MERIGDRLRKRREELGYTINDMARVTRFRPETIMAVEEGRAGVFPAEAYLKAFLRAYANTLGLDADEIVREQKSEEERIREAIKGIRVHPRRSLNLRRVLPWVGIAAAGVIVLAIAFDRFTGGTDVPVERVGPGSVTEGEVTGAADAGDEDAEMREEVGEVGDGTAETGDGTAGTGDRDAGTGDELGEAGDRDVTPGTPPQFSPIRSLSKLVVTVSGWPIRARLRSGDSVMVEGWLRPGYADSFYSNQPFVIDYLTDRDAVSLTLDGETVNLPTSRDKQISDLEIGSGQ
jgi:transcriptional regulator with XRE-family HTH domain